MSFQRFVPGVIGVAGHVDHGKSALIHRMTGCDPDRLPEEKHRGMTLDLGFASLLLSDGRTLGLIDVPGHHRYLHTAIAGFSALRGMVLTVAADEGVMPQTREHLAVASLLGVPHGMAVLTRVDLAEPGLADLAREEVRTLVKGTFLEGRPVPALSSRTGEGLDELARSLEAMAARFPAEEEPPRVFRMWVQRTFTPRGHGTVVTGVPLHGTVQVGDEMEVADTGMRARVRRLTAFGEEVPLVEGPHSMGMELAGLPADRVSRGCTVCRPGTLHPAGEVLAELRLLPDAGVRMRSRSEMQVFHGTSRTGASVRLLGRRTLEPGEACPVRLRFRKPLLVVPGDRLVIRRPSPPGVAGGCRVLETPSPGLPAPSLASLSLRRHALENHTALLRDVVEQAGVRGTTRAFLLGRTLLEPLRLEQELRALEETGDIVLAPRHSLYLSSASVERLGRSLLHMLRGRLASDPLATHVEKPVLAEALGCEEPVLEAVLDHLVRRGRLFHVRNIVRLPPEAPSEEDLSDPVVRDVRRRIEEAGLRPVRLPDLDIEAAGTVPEVRAALGLLLRCGLVVALERRSYVSARARARARERVLALARSAGGEPLGFARVKEALGVSNRDAKAYLEHFCEADEFLERRGSLYRPLPPGRGRSGAVRR